MDCSFLPVGSVSKSLCPEWEGFATILEGWQMAADTLQSALVHGSGSSIPLADGRGEGGYQRAPLSLAG